MHSSSFTISSSSLSLGLAIVLAAVMPGLVPAAVPPAMRGGADLPSNHYNHHHHHGHHNHHHHNHQHANHSVNMTAAMPALPVNTSSTPSASPSPSPCSGCRLARVDTELSAAEIRRRRLELIKKEILEKLGLESVPNITRTQALPPPLSQLHVLDDEELQEDWDTNDDFYGKLTQLIVIGKEVSKCYKQKAAGCFRFRTKQSLSSTNLASATLWVYKLPDDGDIFNQTILVQELGGAGHTQPQLRNLAGSVETSLKAGWIQINIRHTVRQWLSRPDRNHGLMITCNTCYMNKTQLPIATKGDLKPFIVINAAPPRRRRPRSSLDICKENESEERQSCCMTPFYVNTAEIELSEYIVQPSGFYVNYCQGSCGDRTQGTYMHTHTLHLLGKDTCCGAVELSSISVLLRDEITLFRKVNLPKMRLLRCGCV